MFAAKMHKRAQRGIQLFSLMSKGSLQPKLICAF
jgi:hypothetical protein